MIKWLQRLFRLKGVTLVQMRSASKPYQPAASWLSAVSYDARGNPYARSHTARLTALYTLGATGDSDLYGTTWSYKSGPPVRLGERRGAS